MSSGKPKGVTALAAFDQRSPDAYNPFRTDDVHFIDWSERNGVYVLTNWCDDVTVYPTLGDFIVQLPAPATIVLESSWESFHLDRRAAVLDLVEAGGHLMLTVPPQETGRERLRMGIDRTMKSDSLDVGVIRRIAMRWAGLRPDAPSYGMKVAAVRDDELAAKVREIVSFMIDVRRTTIRRVGANLRSNAKFSDGSVFDAGMDLFYERITAAGLVPPLEGWDPRTRAALSNESGDEYAKSLVTTLALVAVFVDTRSVFDRVTGMHVNARPSMIRSQLIWHGGDSYKGKWRKKELVVAPWATRTEHRAACRRLWRAFVLRRGEVEQVAKQVIADGAVSFAA